MNPSYSGVSITEYFGYYFGLCINSLAMVNIFSNSFMIVDLGLYFNKQPYTKSMNPEVLIQLPKCNINYFKQRQKGLLSSGPCTLQNRPTYLNFKSSRTMLQIPKKSIIARLQQVDYVTYLSLHKEGGINTISVPSGDILNESFYNVLKEYLEVVEYFALPPDMEFRKKVLEDCPIGQPGGSELGATNDDKLNQIGQGIGNVFGGISNVVDLDKINKASNDTVSRVSKNIFGERVLSKWQIFKNKCSEVNDAMTDALKPVSDKCKEIAGDIGRNFERSDNTFIKNVRDYSKKTEVALNSGYDKGDAPRRASYMPNQEGPRGPGQTPQSQNDSQRRTVNFGNNSQVIQQEKLNERKSLL